MKTGRFIHDGKLYDLGQLALIHDKLPVTLEVRDLTWALEHYTPDKERLLSTDPLEPIYVTHDSQGRLAVIDGLHRLHNAVAANRSTIYGVYVSPTLL